MFVTQEVRIPTPFVPIFTFWDIFRLNLKSPVHNIFELSITLDPDLGNPWKTFAGSNEMFNFTFNTKMDFFLWNNLLFSVLAYYERKIFNW